jgi:hypothetical protein
MDDDHKEFSLISLMMMMILGKPCFRKKKSSDEIDP